MVNKMGKIIRIGVGVMLKKGNLILLGKRHVDKVENGYKVRENNLGHTWSMPGGKLELDESILECAKRETLEETGIKISSARVISVHDATESTESFSGQAKTMESDKITDWQWFDMNDLPKPLFIATHNILDVYKKGAFYIST